MSFNSEHKVVYGADARTPKKWARETFCDWLAGKLNDPAGPYAEPLGITAERQVVVTDNSLVSREAYSSAGSPPVVFVMQGPVDTMQSGATIDGVAYKGSRHMMQLELDMGINDADAESDDETAEIRDDEMLADFVTDAIERGYSELDALGLNNSELTPDTEKQRAGEGRYPHRLSFFCRTIHTYPAAWDEPAGE